MKNIYIDLDNVIAQEEKGTKSNAGSSTESDQIFFTRMVINYLKTCDNSYTNFYFLSTLIENQFMNSTALAKMIDKVNKHREMNKKERMLGTSTLLKDILDKNCFQKLADKLEKENPEVSEPISIRNTTRTLQDILDLTDIEAIFLDMGCRTRDLSYNIFRTLTNMGMSYNNKITMFSVLLKQSPKSVKQVFDGILFQSGILSKEGECPEGFYGINPDLSDLFSNQNLTIEDLDEAFFPHMITTDLKMKDYPNLQSEISRCVNILETSHTKKSNDKGINLLFWGLPGCGKTELSIAMAKEQGWNIKVIGDIGQSNMNENSRSSRLTSLKVATKIFRNQPKTILLFDEMEDLFKTDTNAEFSKAFINRIIETTEIPIIWTTNSLRALGQPVLRRMTYNIEFDMPPSSTREHIWKKYNKKYNTNIKKKHIKLLSEKYDIVPALIHNAIKVCSTVFRDNEKVELSELDEIIGSLDTLVRFGDKRVDDNLSQKPSPKYDPSLTNTSHDLNIFTKKLVDAPNKGFAVALYGAAGTGKSAYARYVADKMGKKVLFKRASDLQSMWLGECEKNIAKAFAEAKEKGKVLIIDEGDTFLQDRKKSRASWETSQVNEMLSQMEYITEPFFLTTNLMDNLDPAAMRRFSFKLRFDFMTPDQAKKMFKSYFGVKAPDDIRKNHSLAAGDFANVKNQVDILGISDPVIIYDMLLDEVKLKDDALNPIGF